ncbi:uncharacterized protein LOC127008965 [Eriocheir sinensis]|uniref:uncharacterized protein LOC127008965 n=1 Tax=Eriocheir sinensis TaxID=95602 RepID=UPI0021C8850B|nr:uncharacterized protein LOC127008965 [Eriocheir sinensis]
MKIVTLVLAALVAGVLSLPRPEQGGSDELILGDEDGEYADFSEDIVYEYAFEISDEATRTYYSRTEIKLSNGDVFGSWAVLLPSDEIQTMVYNVTKGNGYRYSLTYTPVEFYGESRRDET